MNKDKVNILLEKYTEKYCLGCYVKISDNCKIQMDNYFTYNNLIDIMDILKLLFDGEED